MSLPLNSKRAKPYAASVPSTSCAASTIVTSIVVFRKYRAKGAACHAAAKFCNVSGADRSKRVALAAG